MSTTNHKDLSVRLPLALWEAATARAKTEDRSLGDLMREALQRHLALVPVVVLIPQAEIDAITPAKVRELVGSGYSGLLLIPAESTTQPL